MKVRNLIYGYSNKFGIYLNHIKSPCVGTWEEGSFKEQPLYHKGPVKPKLNVRERKDTRFMEECPNSWFGEMEGVILNDIPEAKFSIGWSDSLRLFNDFCWGENLMSIQPFDFSRL
jgi:hypothetical protein